MDSSFIKGIVPPILTPVDKDESIDEDRLRRLVEHVIKGGVHGILAFGSNGEFYMFDETETERGLKIILSQAKGRIPVYLGIGAVRTGKCIALAKMARRCEAAGVSVLQPMFLKPLESELYGHFKTVADAVPALPVLLYNDPGRTGYTLSAELVERLAANIRNIVGIKDSSGDIRQTAEFIRVTRGRGFRVFGGEDSLVYAVMSHGGIGAVAVTANMFPELVCSIYEKYLVGDSAGSLEAQFRLNPVRLAMDKASFPAASKDMANLMGLDLGFPVLPTLPSESKTLERMRAAMRSAGLLRESLVRRRQR